ncbi:ankyrin repeat domain-containing protein [Pseudoalteromonas rubra]|uniref:Uncharacterized protein n=1 Tax=Pseudoalteromonas rubra TaxID=43658 RepID=A0A0U3HQ40_9GAMM|nr:ankyrin repeat domain-containing protein [Pseudoalteromonas rubra]ALU43385.1 hypothetical protein AT705_10780 [Pseudoalteromonas rubra]
MNKEILELAQQQQWTQLTTLLQADSTVVNVQDEKGYSPLHYAAIQGQCAVIDALVAKGSALEAATGNGSTALHKAATFGQLDAIHTLLSLGADLEARTNNPDVPSFSARTPLHEAAVEGHADAVTLLLSLGADQNALTDAQETALDLAVYYKHTDAAAALSRS